MYQKHLKLFHELTQDELYQILRLRSLVFVVEQNCVFLDMDNKDQKAYHCFIKKEEGEIMAYTRLFNAGDYFSKQSSIGRVLVNPLFRKKDLGKQIMEISIEACLHLFPNTDILIGAQTYLEKFYKELGFKFLGIHYLEDGIPHQYRVYENR